MAWDNRKYIIVNVSEITDEMIASALQTSSSTLYKTRDNSKALLKWDGETPSVFSGMTTYSNSQILTILNDENGDWYTEQ